MSELEPATHGAAGDYSDLTPVKPEVEYAMSPAMEAINMLKFYGRGVLNLIDVSPTDVSTLCRLTTDIALLRQQYPTQELKPFFTVNFGDNLKPTDLGERLRNMVPIQIDSRWEGYPIEELNRRSVVGDDPANLSLRAMVVRRQKSGQLVFPWRSDDGAESCHALSNVHQRHKFEMQTPGRTLMNLTDLLLVSAIWTGTKSNMFKPIANGNYQKTWHFRSPFLGFKFRTFRPFVNVAVDNQYMISKIAMTHESRVNLDDDYLTVSGNNVSVYDSVGITLR